MKEKLNKTENELSISSEKLKLIDIFREVDKKYKILKQEISKIDNKEDKFIKIKYFI